MEPVLEIRNLNVDYGLGNRAVHAVRDVNLTLHKGEVLGLTWVWRTSTLPSFTSASKSSGSAASCSAARSRPRHPKHRCLSPS